MGGIRRREHVHGTRSPRHEDNRLDLCMSPSVFSLEHDRLDSRTQSVFAPAPHRSHHRMAIKYCLHRTFRYSRKIDGHALAQRDAAVGHVHTYHDSGRGLRRQGHATSVNTANVVLHLLVDKFMKRGAAKRATAGGRLTT